MILVAHGLPPGGIDSSVVLSRTINSRLFPNHTQSSLREGTQIPTDLHRAPFLIHGDKHSKSSKHLFKKNFLNLYLPLNLYQCGRECATQLSPIFKVSREITSSEVFRS